MESADESTRATPFIKQFVCRCVPLSVSLTCLVYASMSILYVVPAHKSAALLCLLFYGIIQ